MSHALPALDAARRPRRQRLRIVLAMSVVAIAAVGLYSALWRYHLKRFQVVDSGIYFRSAQPTEWGLWYLQAVHGLKTVVSLQLHDFRLYRGTFDFGAPDGAAESEYVKSLGVRHVQWPMGDEQCWPWPDAWELEEFFRLVDDPANRPILVHCMGGRHRTGTLSALYRLEYDRWSPDAALVEMYSFQFGNPIPVQEHNLRTYLPRPLPDALQWKELAEKFDLDAAAAPAKALPSLVHAIRHAGPNDLLRRKFLQYVEEEKAFAVPLTTWVVRETGDFLPPQAVVLARRAIESPTADAQTVSAAAALIADFGSTDDQAALVEQLQAGRQTSEPTAHYESLVAGVTNRYTANRLPYLRGLLEDRRRRIGSATAKYAYCNTAVYRFAGITGALPVLTWPDADLLVEGRDRAGLWFESHPEALKPGTLVPPGGRRTVLTGEAPVEEDLSKMRR
jgi:tyrosine-protein phosphatase SIW14